MDPYGIYNFFWKKIAINLRKTLVEIHSLKTLTKVQMDILLICNARFVIRVKGFKFSSSPTTMLVDGYGSFFSHDAYSITMTWLLDSRPIHQLTSDTRNIGDTKNDFLGPYTIIVGIAPFFNTLGMTLLPYNLLVLFLFLNLISYCTLFLCHTIWC